MNNSKWTYYITCFISGMVELGSVFLGMKLGCSLAGIIGLALAYQLGNVFRFWVTKKVSEYQLLLAGITLVLSVVINITGINYYIRYASCFVMFVLFSTILQNIRSVVSGDIPRWKKRSCRVVGFAASAIYFYCGMIMMVIMSGIILVLSIVLEHYYYDNWLKEWCEGKKGKRICYAMVFHQAHYFAYNYITLYLIMRTFNSPLYASLAFVANWIPYTITEPLVKKLKWDKWYVISIGAHLFNSVVLIGMFVFLDINILWTVCLWVLTGFGGGNVFCIKKAIASKYVYDKDVWSFSEQIGHIVGVLSALIIVWSGIAEKYSMIVAVAFALFTIPMIVKECS